MLKSIRFTVVLLVWAALMTATGSSVSQVFASPRSLGTSPTLHAVASYAVLAGSIVTNTGPTTMSANLGVSPSIGVGPHVTGFPPGIVSLPGTIHDADAPAAAAQADNTAAFGFLDQPCDVSYPALQNLTLVSPLGPGVYCAPAFALTGNLALTGSGVWIFKTASTLITSPGSSVTGGDPCNVWWRVGSSATLDTTTNFSGNILALTSISLRTGARMNGRALAQTGAVTMDSNTFTTQICAAPSTATPTPAGTLTVTAVPPTATPTATRFQTATPTRSAPGPGPANTSVPAPTSTPAPTLVSTPVQTPTGVATAPAVVGVPNTGGAAPQDGYLRWILLLLALIIGGFGAFAFSLASQARRTRR
jgi:hypothetical protein